MWKLFRELRRRRVLQTAALYLAGAWVVFQVADIFFPAWGLPEAALQPLLLGVVLGFPLALIFGWKYDVTTHGIVRTHAPTATEAPDLSLRRGDYVTLLALVAAAGLIVYSVADRLGEPSRAAPTAPHEALTSLAVLPFRDSSPTGDKQYFSDGIHEELIARLTDIEALRVVSRTSVLPYRDSPKSVRAIGEELGVDAVVEGSVRHSGNRIRITAQLIDANTDSSIWTRNYDRQLSMEELFSIQTDVALRIANSLQAQLRPKQREALDRLPTGDLEAYDTYLAGRARMADVTPDAIRESMALFEEAVALDPRFARAHEYLGWAHAYTGTAYGRTAPTEAFSEAKRHALRALELDPNSGTAQELLASIIYWHEWDAETAEPVYRRAVELEPRNYSVWTGYAYFLGTQGRHEEAIKAIEAAIEVDPQNRNVYSNAAWRYLDARDYARAEAMARRSLEIDPDFIEPLHPLGWLHVHTGRMEEALAYFEKAGNGVGTAYVHAREGREAEAREILEGFEEQARTGYYPAYWIAEIYMGLGDTDAVFQWLEKSYAQRDRSLLLLDVSRVWDPIRDDPRFHVLRSRVQPGRESGI